MSLQTLGILIAIIIFAYFALNYARSIIYEIKANNLYRKQKKELTDLQNRSKQPGPMLKSAYDNEVSLIVNKYKNDIEEYERKRKYLLERLPFIKP